MSFFKWLWEEKPQPKKEEPAPKKEEKSAWEQAREAEAAEVKRLLEVHKNELADKYIVEVTTKDATVYKTDVFEYYCYAHAEMDYYGEAKVKYVRGYFISSKEKAENFVSSNSKERLVRFGDEFICPKTISKVRLVKV